MKYELLNEDEHSYQLKDPGGKEVRIAKKAISDALHERIKGYAKGGLVTPIEEQDEPFDFNKAGSLSFDKKSEDKSEPGFFSQMGGDLADVADQMKDTFNTGVSSPYMVSNEEYAKRREQEDVLGGLTNTGLGYQKTEPAAAQNLITNSPLMSTSSAPTASPAPGAGLPAPSISAQPSPQPQQAMPLPTAGATEGYGNPLNQMAGAAKAKGAAESQYYTEAQKLQDASNAKQAEIDAAYNKNSAAIEKQNDALFQAASTQKIDPGKWYNSKSTAGKISSTIGLILGGIGAGLTRGPNVALETMNRLVDQDIDAQKAELGKKQTLYSMNLQKYRDSNMAYMATKAQTASMLQGQLASAAAKMGSQTSLAAAQQATAQINLVRQQLSAQLAKAQTEKMILSHIKNTGDTQYADYLSGDTKTEVLGRAVPGIGLATTKEAAAKANELVTTTRAGIDLIGQLRSFADKPSAKFSIEDRAKAETLSRMIMGQIREGVLGPGTVNDQERKILESIVANPTNISQLPSTAKKSLNTIIESIENKQRIGLTQYGLSVPKKLDKGAPIR